MCRIVLHVSLKRNKSLLQVTDIPQYTFAKIGLDLCGPFPTSMSGYNYILTFVDHYSRWIEEIFPRFGGVLEMCNDNGNENNRAGNTGISKYRLY